MKNTTEERIEYAKKVSTENLIETIKNNYPERFDQMLIDDEERKIYYYIKYKSVAFKRKPFVVKFPLFSSWKKDFEENINALMKSISDGGSYEIVTAWSITLMKSLTMNSNKKSGVGKFRHRSIFSAI